MRTRHAPLFWRQALALAVLLGGLACGGCGVRQLAQGEMEPPKVSLQGISLGRPGPQGWPVAVTLHLTNPNSQAINVLGYDYNLWLEGASVAQGESQTAVLLPAKGETLAEVPILIKMAAVANLLPGLLAQPRQQLHYRVTGGLRLALVLGGLVRIPFYFQGQTTPEKGLEDLRQLLH